MSRSVIICPQNGQGLSGHGVAILWFRERLQCWFSFRFMEAENPLDHAGRATSVQARGGAIK
jgi:hypothetical protein